MSVLVIGSSGFIGSHLVDHLSRGGKRSIVAADIVAVPPEVYRGPGVSSVELDVTSKESFANLNRYSVDTVVNLASKQPANTSLGNPDPQGYVLVNVVGLINVLEYCKRAEVSKVVHVISHQGMRGAWKEGVKIREDTPAAPVYSGEYSLFSISELAALDVVRHYHEAYGMRILVLRLPPVYGVGPHTEIFRRGMPEKTGFQIFIEHAISGEAIEIWGDPHKGRDLVYVKDVVRAIRMGMDKRTAEGLVNVASGRYTTLQEEVDSIINVFSEGTPPKLTYRKDLENGIEPFLYDIEKAKNLLGWEPKYSFRDMLVDYKKDLELGKFDFLIRRRRRLLKEK